MRYSYNCVISGCLENGEGLNRHYMNASTSLGCFTLEKY